MYDFYSSDFELGAWSWRRDAAVSLNECRNVQCNGAATGEFEQGRIVCALIDDV